MAKKSDLEMRLEDLDRLKLKGTITEEEYATRRSALMTETPAPTVAGKKGGFPILRVGCLGLIGVVVLIIIIAALASSGGSDPKSSSKTGTPLASNEAQVGDLLLTVNAVNATYVDQLFPAEAGTHYVAIDISGKNTGNSTYSLNLLNFHLKDSSGFANDTATTQGPDPRIAHHDLTKDQSVRGFLVFKVKDGATAVELQYQSFTGTPGTIKVSQ